MQEQDEQLELVSGSIRVLKDMSGRIGDELDEQAVWVYERAIPDGAESWFSQ